MTVDQQLQKIEQEIQAIRAAFAQNVANMEVYTATLDFTTSRNTTNWSNSQPYDPTKWPSLIPMQLDTNDERFDTETVIVTFDCSAGINTFADLEVDSIDTSPGLTVVSTRRIPYSGGARWSVTVSPNFSGSGPGMYVWKPSKLKFAVQSAAPGTLTAKMLWQ